MPRKTLKILWLSLFALTVASCGTVPIRDQEWCGDKGAMGASCFHTLSDEKRQLDRYEWAAERFGMVCTKAENFADTKAAIEKLCRTSKRCSYEDKVMLKKFFTNIDAMKSAGGIAEQPVSSDN